MGAWRKAGVWLGLVEDEDDRDGFYDDEYGEDEDFAVPVRPRPLVRAQRSPERAERDRVERDRLDRAHDRLERDRATADRAAADRALSDRIDRDRLERDRLDRERDRDRLERDRLERDRLGRTGGRDLRVDPEDPDERDLRGVRDVRGDREARTVRELHFGSERDNRGVDPVESRLSSTRLTESRPSDESRGTRSSVRQFPRPTAGSTAGPTAGSTALSVPAEEELALAPQVQLRERAAVADERSVRRYAITTLHPTSYSEARAIGEQFRDGHPVIMNLTEMDEPDAKRLVDFAAGLAFGLRGSMERVTNRVFLLTPPNIRVSDEEKQRIAETGFFDAR
jgi:cell division inhibitor SepF